MATQIDLSKAWDETTAGTTSGATATHAAASNVSHVITSVSGHSDEACTLSLKDGSTVIAEWGISAPVADHWSRGATALHFDDDVVAAANGVLLRAGYTTIHSIDMHNVTAADAFLLLYDKVAATSSHVVVGTTVPNYVIPNTANGVVHRSFPLPLLFKVGIVYASTTTTDGSTAAAQDLSVGYSANIASISEISNNGLWVGTAGNAVSAVISGSAADCQVNFGGFSIP